MERTLSVSQLNEYVRRTLAADPMLRGIRLGGEISNFKRHSAGHLYFSLKDEGARVACVMFRSAAAGLAMQPRDGQRVVLRGSAALYTQTGQYQFYVDSMQEKGEGDLHAAFERLKAQLTDEGLFDAGLKKPLPMLPRAVGIVTSETGAVLHDICQVAQRRNPCVQLVLHPAAVQGAAAAAEIVRGIRALDRMEEVDVIIVGRGGGSLEELWAFNEEAVARAIFACRTPVVSAVGHETDFTIADFVADVRAPTPSAAAELVIGRRAELFAMLDGYRTRLRREMAQQLTLAENRLARLMASLGAQSPQRRIAERRQRLGALAALLSVRVRAGLAARRAALNAAGGKLPGRGQAAAQRRRFRLDATYGRLHALSPGRVLARGYAMVTDAKGAPVTDAGQAAVGERIRIRMRGGALGAEITEVDDHGTQTDPIL